MKKSMWMVAVVISALMFAGCGKKEESAASEPKADEAVAEKAAEPKEEAKNEAAQAADPAAENQEALEGPKDMQEMAAALGRAMQAAAKVEGDTPCERGYNGLTKMMEAMGGGDDKVPTKDKYMEVCKTLPEAMQKCMDMSYAMKNVQECKKVQEETDPAVIERAKALMSE